MVVLHSATQRGVNVNWKELTREQKFPTHNEEGENEIICLKY